jgi:hypothetical protein
MEPAVPRRGRTESTRLAGFARQIAACREKPPFACAPSGLSGNGPAERSEKLGLWKIDADPAQGNQKE